MTKFPNDYIVMEELGILSRLQDADDELIVFDVEFHDAAFIQEFEPLDDQVIEILPFATTASGDFWAYSRVRMPSSPVLLCYHDSDEAVVFADGLRELIIYQTVALCFGVPLNRTEGWTAKDVSETLAALSSGMSGFLPENACGVFESLRVAADAVGEQLLANSLITYDEGRQLIESMAPSAFAQQSIAWRS